MKSVGGPGWAYRQGPRPQRFEELPCPGLQKVELAAGHKEPESLGLEQAHLGWGAGGPAENLAMTFDGRGYLGNGRIEPGMVLLASEAQRARRGRWCR